MMYKALISFTGSISMAMGDVREITDVALADRLQRVGYISPIGDSKPDEKEKIAKSPRTPRKKKKGE